jgi:hypothetical protein
VCLSPNSYEVLHPNEMVWGGWGFGKWLDLDEIIKVGPPVMDLVTF